MKVLIRMNSKHILKTDAPIKGIIIIIHLSIVIYSTNMNLLITCQ